MLEITNKTKSPIQILIKSTQGSYNKDQKACINTTRAFKSLNLPGLGGGMNVITIPDEKMTDHIKQLEAKKLIKVRHV